MDDSYPIRYQSFPEQSFDEIAAEVSPALDITTRFANFTDERRPERSFGVITTWRQEGDSITCLRAESRPPITDQSTQELIARVMTDTLLEVQRIHTESQNSIE